MVTHQHIGQDFYESDCELIEEFDISDRTL